MKAHKRKKGTDPPILILDRRQQLLVNSHPDWSIYKEKFPLSFEQDWDTEENRGI